MFAGFTVVKEIKLNIVLDYVNQIHATGLFPHSLKTSEKPQGGGGGGGV